MNFDKEKSKARWVLFAKISGILIGGFVVAPFVFLAIKGLVGAAIALVLAAVVFKLAPVFGVMLANVRLKLLKAEAMKNPVETLQRDYIAGQEKLQRADEFIVNFDTATRNYENKMESFTKRWPEDAEKHQEKHQTMLTLLEEYKQDYNEASVNLEEYKGFIEKQQAEWEMAVEAMKLDEAAKVDSDEFERQLMTNTAIQSVQTSLNRAFSTLDRKIEKGRQVKEMRFGENKAPLQIEEKPVDISSTLIKTKPVTVINKR